MELGLRDKIVAITGGTSGIGKACALRYLEEGCKVAVCGRDEAKLDAFRKECRKAGFPEPLCHATDVAEPDQLEAFVESVVATFGGLDIWYNNAGFGIRRPMMRLTLDEWDRQMSTNLRAVFYGTQLAARRMGQGGVIVNASSWGARIPVAGNGPYAVSKWGVEGMTRVFAGELAPRGIRVFSYTPGMIETELTRPRIEASREKFASAVALGRLGQPEDLAPVLVMLTSSLAGYFTGCTIEISGGKFCVQNPTLPWTDAAFVEGF